MGVGIAIGSIVADRYVVSMSKKTSILLVLNSKAYEGLRGRRLGSHVLLISNIGWGVAEPGWQRK
jgi:hypothetical protein